MMLLLIPASMSAAGTKTKAPGTFTVLQWNIWQEGTSVKGGYDAILNELERLQPDFVTFSEVRNYKDDFIARVCADMAKRGLTYYGFRSDDTGLLSAHPITAHKTVFPLNDDHGSIYKLESEVCGQKVAIYTSHLDYLNDTYYEVRGINGCTFKEMQPLTDTKEILRRNALSMRDEAIANFVKEAARDRQRGVITIIGGDFNEPSVQDWTERTKNLYDHHGVVVDWPATTELIKAGFSDAYRTFYPDELTHPGFTFPADNPLVPEKKLTWAPKSDERDRIDYIFYRGEGIRVTDCKLFGPEGNIAYSKRVPLGTGEPVITPLGVWPSDHKGVLATFAVSQPLGQYDELTDTKPHDSDSKWTAMKQPTHLSWASTDVRYKKLSIPDVAQQNTWNAKAWRGERVNAQALLWTNTDLGDCRIDVSDLKCGGNVIPASAIRTHFVRYVMTDELNKDGKGGCGYRIKSEWDSSVVADILDINKMLPVKRNTTQPIWINVWVPQNAKPGTYTGTVTVSGDNMSQMKLNVKIQVGNRTLPEPQQWKMNLDLWQNPYSVARYYNVPLWSKEHFDAMRPIMKMLADAGQYAVTTSIMHKPWNGQTEDHYDSMVSRVKHLDGSWSYDYAVFDKWVDFMMNDVGINRLISCYTMIPWDLSFDYYDEATNRIQFVKAKPGDKAYAEYWVTFLKDFSRHLREKGWFDKTAISMDERPVEDMQAAIKVIKEADPEFKITLAGIYHKEIESDLYYYCIAYGYDFPADVKARRRAEGKVSTYYTCCTEAFPNTFTFSPPAEAVWTAIHAVAGDYDGYLRWSYNSWTADPLRDSRFRTWAAGDCYSIYPGPRSSIRFERLVEGLQDAEKIIQLRKEYENKGQKAKLARLNKAVGKFTPQNVPLEKAAQAAKMVNELEQLLNE